jgi:hypothetical protein
MTIVRWHALRNITALVVGVLVALLSTVRAEERPLSVFVFTATTASTESHSQQRSDSVIDLRNALKDKKRFTLASTRNSADLVVEITRAGMVDRECVVDLTVSAGDYTQRFTNTDAPPSGKLYLSAAANLAGQLTTWTKDNRAQILK